MRLHDLKAGIGISVVASLLAAACGTPPADGIGGTGPAARLSEEAVAELEKRCGDAAESIGESRKALTASLQGIEELVRSSPQAVEIRAEITEVSELLAQGPAEELTGEQIRRVAPTLVTLSERLVGLGATGCATVGEVAGALLPSPLTDAEAVRAVMAEHRELWRSERITTYHFVLSAHLEESLPEETEPPCGVFGWLFIQVVDGHPERAVDRYSGCEVDREVAERRGLPLTVEDLFDLVAAHADTGVIQVDYHPDLGYPRTIFVEGEGTVIDLSVQEFGVGPADLSGREAVLAELEANRRLWAAQRIEDYSFTVEVDCFCPPEFRGPFEVWVASGETARATFGGEPIGERVDGRFLTVEGLFGFVERNSYADAIEVTYDSEFGYPEVIDVDPVRNAIDDEVRVSILEFSIP
jgi:hypothetical protein